MRKVLIITALMMALCAMPAHAKKHGNGKDKGMLSGNDFMTAVGLSVSDLETTSASGVWDITAVYTEAAFTNTFNMTDGLTDSLLFSNKDTSNWYDAVTVDLGDTWFSDGKYRYNLDGCSSSGIFTALLKTSFTYNGVAFNAGDLLIMFNDSAGDKDYDDFVLHGTASTPIPGAAWLLGSGLVGLVGLRRKLNA